MHLSIGYRNDNPHAEACVQKWDNRMLPDLPCFPRNRRAAVKNVTCAISRHVGHASATRARKGLKACSNTAWRRTTTGSNHISAYGVWRDRARRAMMRANRTGETRWHRLPEVALAINFFRGRQ